MWHKLKEEIEVEFGELNRLLKTFNSLLETVNTRTPNDVETIALAGMLHSFYTGVENIFKRVAITTDTICFKSL